MKLSLFGLVDGLAIIICMLIDMNNEITNIGYLCYSGLKCECIVTGNKNGKMMSQAVYRCYFRRFCKGLVKGRSILHAEGSWR